MRLQKLYPLLSPLWAILIMSGWVGILTNSNVYCAVPVPMQIAAPIFLIGNYGIFRSIIEARHLGNDSQIIVNLSVLAIMTAGIGIAPILLMATSLNFQQVAWWIALAAPALTYAAIHFAKSSIRQ